tara:strand:+ start:4149 stop:4337 length:189 start_codon:yes stop_codon:yes gene_type:complete
MKLHQTLIDKLIQVIEVNSGWPEQKKLRLALASLDLAVYTQQNGAEVLVDAQELAKQIRNTQ